MRILVSNDDGVFAPGLSALVTALQAVGEVVVVAPDRERSAISHAITMHKPLRAQPVNIAGCTGWAVSGTPADCVMLGLRELLDEPPDLVVSGINRGANLGEDVWYSGTVGAAMEGAMAGVPAMAVSVVARVEVDFRAAAQFAAQLATGVVNRLEPDLMLNINVPNLAPEAITGVELCRQGRRHYQTAFERRSDPRGGTYYWLGSGCPQDELTPGTDVAAVEAGRIAVTPVSLDLTREGVLDSVHGWLGDELELLPH